MIAVKISGKDFLGVYCNPPISRLSPDFKGTSFTNPYLKILLSVCNFVRNYLDCVTKPTQNRKRTLV